MTHFSENKNSESERSSPAAFSGFLNSAPAVEPPANDGVFALRKNKQQEMSGTRVTFDSGTEGPSHDPYGWDSITVYRGGHEFEFESHALGDTTFKLDGKLLAGGCSDAEARQAAEEFERLSGGGPGEWMRWHHRAHSRCSCGCRETGSMAGYPGEHFEVCVRCGNIVSASFHESEII